MLKSVGEFCLLWVGFGLLYCLFVGLVSVVKAESRVAAMKYAVLNGFIAAVAYLLIKNNM